MKLSHFAGAALATLVVAISPASAAPPRPDGPPRPVVDADKDGVITRAEAAAAADRLFDEMDKEKKGYLTAEDFKPPMHGRGGPEGRRDHMDRDDRDRRGPDGPGGPPRPPRPPHPPMGLFVMASIEEADANGDGKISKDEFRALQLRFFDAADVNGDGKLKLPPRPPEPPEPPAPPPPR